MSGKWYTPIYYNLLYYSGFFSQLRFMKISCLHPERKYREETVVKKQKKIYWINTNLESNIVDIFFKEVLKKEANLMKMNVDYFRSYLKYFYDYEISKEEMERILKTIQEIRKNVKNEYAFFSSKDKNIILNLLETEDYYYKKTTKDTNVFLYKMNYLGKTTVVKLFEYFPKYVFSKYIIENQFETEVVFQKYAESLNTECDFISPKIYSFGTVSKPRTLDFPETKYLFIIMEYMEGISLKHAEFRPNVCKQIYEIDQQLKKRFLSHNDMKSRNIILSEKDDLIVLDYGESTLCI